MSRPPYFGAKADNRRLRRIIAEDVDWSLHVVPCLSKLCLQSIVRNFEEKPIFEDLPPLDRVFVQERLATSLPLHVTANSVSDGVFWKRCCEQRWDICDLADYGHSWKRMFFERHVENIIELFIPDETEPKAVLEMVPLCKNYVKRLDISQLLPPIKEPEKKEEEEEYGPELAGPSMDHFDFNILLKKLTKLEELHLVYRVKQCGMNFERTMFEMTDRDCESLAKALVSCKTLKLLRLHQSNIEDKKCRRLVRNLLDHPSLTELDLSHNVIGDKGAAAIGGLLARNKLETLNMCDNNIRGPGAEAIARALSVNSSLLSLNLRLNRVGDGGGRAIGEALLNNRTLLHLHLGANVCTAVALSKVLVENGTLKSINLSCNNLGVADRMIPTLLQSRNTLCKSISICDLGPLFTEQFREDGGRALQEAMSHNTSVTECDIRLTQIDEQSVSFINKAVWTNQRPSKQQQQQQQQTADPSI